jgi:drug/metabolite transporter (DMT)-like permease
VSQTVPSVRPSARSSVTIQFVLLGLLWGGSFLFMKVALEGVSFGQVAWTRLVLGALALAAIVLVTRTRLPRSPIVYLHFVVIGLSGCVLPYLLFSWAEQYVSSGLASIYNAVTPITTALLVTLAFRVEKLDRAQVLGVIVGILGVIVIIGPWRFVPTASAAGSPVLELAGQLACLGSAVCYGFSFGYIRRFAAPHGVKGLAAAFLQIGMGAVVMLVLTPFLALGPVQLSLPVVSSLVTLGLLGTGVAYVWYMNVLDNWGPTATSTVTYVTPVVGVALGIIVLGESLSWHEPLGALLVFLGILLAQRRIRLGRLGLAGGSRKAVSRG